MKTSKQQIILGIVKNHTSRLSGPIWVFTRRTKTIVTSYKCKKNVCVHPIKSYYDDNIIQYILKYHYKYLLIKDIIGCISRKIIEYKLIPQKSEESENA